VLHPRLRANAAQLPSATATLCDRPQAKVSQLIHTDHSASLAQTKYGSDPDPRSRIESPVVGMNEDSFMPMPCRCRCRSWRQGKPAGQPMATSESPGTGCGLGTPVSEKTLGRDERSQMRSVRRWR